MEHWKRLSAGPPDRSFLTEILDGLAVALDCERIHLFRLRERGGFHVLIARSRDLVNIPRASERISHHAVRRMAGRGTSIFVPDARQDRRFRTEESAGGKRTAVSILAIPIFLEGGLYGGVYADHRFQALEDLSATPAAGAWMALLSAALYLRLESLAARRLRRELEAARVSLPRDASRPTGKTKAAAPEPDESTEEVEDLHGFISANPDIRDLFDSIRNLGASDLPILIQGETGTGKGLLARAIHESSTRRDHPFVTLHAATVPEALFESELLGHVRGAFTGAEANYDGVFVRADRGTLLLDEIGETTLEVQKKLLRVLEDGLVRALGAKEPVQVDVRLISTTSRNLEKLVRQGRFRRDLFYRLKGVDLLVPPLRDRREDVLPLALGFLEKHARAAGKKPPELTAGARGRLLRHSWPGNAREVENEMRKLVALGADPIEPRHLSPTLARQGRSGEGDWPSQGSSAWRLDETVELAEREAIVGALKASRGNKSRAAKHLGITRKSLYRRMAKYGIGGEETDAGEAG